MTCYSSLWSSRLLHGQNWKSVLLSSYPCHSYVFFPSPPTLGPELPEGWTYVFAYDIDLGPSEMYIEWNERDQIYIRLMAQRFCQSCFCYFLWKRLFHSGFLFRIRIKWSEVTVSVGRYTVLCPQFWKTTKTQFFPQFCAKTHLVAKPDQKWHKWSATCPCPSRMHSNWLLIFVIM